MECYIFVTFSADLEKLRSSEEKFVLKKGKILKRTLIRRMVRLGLLAAAGMIGTSVPAQDSKPVSVEERLKKLEDEVVQLRNENRDLRNGLGVDKPGSITVRPLGKEVDLRLGGFIQGQAEFGDKGDSRWATGNDRFLLRRARINATGTFAEHFDFKIEFDLAGTLSDTTGLRAGMTDGYINWNRYDWANVKVGQFKTPFGYEQLLSDTKLYTAERTLANDRLTMGRQLGVQVGGDVLEKRLFYASGMFNGSGVNNNYNDNDSFMFVERLGGIPWQGKLFNKDGKWSVAGNVFYSDDRGLTGMGDFGFDSSAAPGVDGIFTGVRKGAAADTQFRWGPVDIWLEYFLVNFDPDNGIPARDFNSEGYYAQAGYFLWKDKLQALVKYESFDPNVDKRGNTTDTWTFGMNYYIKGDDLKLQLNYLLFDAAGQPPDRSKLILRMQAMF
jgi:phosphate-selective porin OprO/OprP